MDSLFRFRQFEVRNADSAFKVGTDAVLLGASMTLFPSDRLLLDIGTGTGVIALMAAQRTVESGALVEAIEIDGPSAAEARINFINSPWADRLSVRNVSLQGFNPGERFNLIFSNPPYFDNSLKNPDPRESVARHTESLSYSDICAFASENLTDFGRLSLVLPAQEEHNLRRTAASFGLFPFRIIRARTTASKAPGRIVAEFSREKTEMREEEIVLQDGSRRTEQFSELTGDFYL